MTTTPPDQPPPTPPASTTGATETPWLGTLPADARLPIPGNAEFALYVTVLILAALVCWIADDLGSGAWLDFLKWTTIAYILSRGIAKASRVLEQ